MDISGALILSSSLTHSTLPPVSPRKPKRLKQEHTCADSPKPNKKMTSLELTGPYRPREEEKLQYYKGLHPRPILIARTSSTPWIPDGPADFDDKHCTERQVVGKHNIVSKYSSNLARLIITALSDFPWVRFYPIRLKDTFYPSHRYSPPVVFIIETLTDEVPWEKAVEVALSCRQIIRSIGITDVEVEIQQTTDVPFAATKELDAVTSCNDISTMRKDIKKLLLPFSSHLGYEINNPKRHATGTMGLHLQLGDEDALFGLTCRHVVLGLGSSQSDDIKDSCDEAHLIRQLGLDESDGLAYRALTRSQIWEDAYQQLEQKIRRWDDWYSTTEETANSRKAHEPTTQERAKLPIYEARSQKAKEVARLIQTAQDDPRIIGHVANAPAVGVSSRGYLRDWALVELDAAKAFASRPTNMVYIGHVPAWYRDIADSDYRSNAGPDVVVETDEDQESDLMGNVDKQGFLKLGGTIPVPTNGKASSLLVGKRGTGTGLTFGYTNEILAVRRHPADASEFIVWEWLVLSRGGYFSSHGDSGSAVWDVNGRVAGMLTRGADKSVVEFVPENQNVPNTQACCPKHSFGTDITFITPAEYLFEDIESFTGQRPHIL